MIKAFFISLLLLGSVHLAYGELDPMLREFMWEQANAQATQARNPVDYTKATQSYLELIAQDGPRQESLLNAASVATLAGLAKPAIELINRAERLYGSTPESTRGLVAAYAIHPDPQQRIIPWTRQLLTWHYRYPLNQRMVYWVYALTLLFTLYAINKLRLVRYLALLIVAILTLSVTLSWIQESTLRPILLQEVSHDSH